MLFFTKLSRGLKLLVLMDTYEEDIHPHCLQCIKFLQCTAVPKPGESCKIINCPSECGAKFHACKIKEHRLLCMKEKVGFVFDIFFLFYRSKILCIIIYAKILSKLELCYLLK